MDAFLSAKFLTHCCVITTFASPCHLIPLGLVTQLWDKQRPLTVPRKELYLKSFLAKMEARTDWSQQRAHRRQGWPGMRVTVLSHRASKGLEVSDREGKEGPRLFWPHDQVGETQPWDGTETVLFYKIALCSCAINRTASIWGRHQTT